MITKVFKRLCKKLSTPDDGNFFKSPLSVRHISRPRILLLGTCQAERLHETGLSLEWTIEHQLCDFNPCLDVGAINHHSFDIIVLNPTLRFVCEFSTGNGDGDILVTQIEQHYETFEENAVRSMHEMLTRYIAHYNTIAPIAVTSFIEPPSSAHGLIARNRHASLYTLVRKLNDELEALCHEQHNTYYLETNDIRSMLGDRLAYDGYDINYTHASYYAGRALTQRLNQALLQKIEAIWRIINKVDPVKLIVTDLDNTLWKGVLAEEESIEGWRHTEGWPLGYVEALLECKQRGILLAVCSKNNKQETLENFRKLWRTRILPEDFCSLKINWQPKPDNIRQILAETNILPEHTLFIDDNPLEIAEVRQAFPAIRTLTVPQEQWRRILLFAPETQIGSATDETRQKTTLIQAKKARDEASQNLSREDFLNSLELELRFEEIHKTKHLAFKRAFELLNKTNQFNSTGKRWAFADMHLFLQQGGVMLATRAKDCFADHGLIGLLLLKDDTVEQFVLSCRVFGLGIEQAMLSHLSKRQKNREIRINSAGTGKNHSFMTFMQSLPMEDNILRSAMIPPTPAWIKLA